MGRIYKHAVHRKEEIYLAREYMERRSSMLLKKAMQGTQWGAVFHLSRQQLEWLITVLAEAEDIPHFKESGFSLEARGEHGGRFTSVSCSLGEQEPTVYRSSRQVTCRALARLMEWSLELPGFNTSPAACSVQALGTWLHIPVPLFPYVCGS